MANQITFEESEKIYHFVNELDGFLKVNNSSSNANQKLTLDTIYQLDKPYNLIQPIQRSRFKISSLAKKSIFLLDLNYITECELRLSNNDQNNTIEIQFSDIESLSGVKEKIIDLQNQLNQYTQKITTLNSNFNKLNDLLKLIDGEWEGYIYKNHPYYIYDHSTRAKYSQKINSQIVVLKKDINALNLTYESLKDSLNLLKGISIHNSWQQFFIKNNNETFMLEEILI